MAEQDRSSMPSGMPLAEPFTFTAADDELEQEEEQQDPRPKSSGEDPFQTVDPWKQYGGTTPPRGQFTGAVTHPGPGAYEGNLRKMMHDVPPEWDGMDPQKNLEPYLKLLQGWLVTTATIPQQRGLILSLIHI